MFKPPPQHLLHSTSQSHLPSQHAHSVSSPNFPPLLIQYTPSPSPCPTSTHHVPPSGSTVVGQGTHVLGGQCYDVISVLGAVWCSFLYLRVFVFVRLLEGLSRGVWRKEWRCSKEGQYCCSSNLDDLLVGSFSMEDCDVAHTTSPRLTCPSLNCSSTSPTSVLYSHTAHPVPSLTNTKAKHCMETQS